MAKMSACLVTRWKGSKPGNSARAIGSFLRSQAKAVLRRAGSACALGSRTVAIISSLTAGMSALLFFYNSGERRFNAKDAKAAQRTQKEEFTSETATQRDAGLGS